MASVDAVIENKLYVGTPKFLSNLKHTSKYWLWVKGGVVVLDPSKIADKLDLIKLKIEKALKDWEEVLIVFDKEFYRGELEKLAEKKGIYYLNNKVPGGVFTNFKTFKKRIDSMNQLKRFIASEAYEKLTKKEKLMKQRQLKKLELIYKWVTSMKKIPATVIVVDGFYHGKVMDELAIIKASNTIVLANTDFDRWIDDESVLFVNTASYKSIDYVLKYLLS